MQEEINSLYPPIPKSSYDCVEAVSFKRGRTLFSQSSKMWNVLTNFLELSKNIFKYTVFQNISYRVQFFLMKHTWFYVSFLVTRQAHFLIVKKLETS